MPYDPMEFKSASRDLLDDICLTRPSDYEELVEWFVEQGENYFKACSPRVCAKTSPCPNCITRYDESRADDFGCTQIDIEFTCSSGYAYRVGFSIASEQEEDDEEEEDEEEDDNDLPF